MTKYKLFTCNCGAVGIDDGTNEVKWASDLETLNKITGLKIKESDLQNAVNSYMCDHCVNHWGLDLCSCGSGELVGECECGSNEASQYYNKKMERSVLWAF